MSSPLNHSNSNMEQEIRYLGDVQRLELNPGDTIVLTLDHDPSDDELKAIDYTMDRAFDGQYKCLILRPGTKIGVMGNGETSSAED